MECKRKKKRKIIFIHNYTWYKKCQMQGCLAVNDRGHFQLYGLPLPSTEATMLELQLLKI